uniref:Trehalase n=1 Tax=Romanomermis culicivorax TaxID=13658 RepID=A0A915J566_ROMCU
MLINFDNGGQFVRKKTYAIVILVLKMLSIGGIFSEKPVYMCDSEIYCRGPILEAVHRLHIYPDSKDYVDMPLKFSPNETLDAFNITFPDKENITKEALQNFIDEYFHPPSRAYEINKLWLQLCKEVNSSVALYPDRYSMLYVPYPFIIPGGRFREFYNWDTYWIELGLLYSGMYNTTKHIIKNFSYLVERYGLVPNGGRTYYLSRSHPPMFIPMVYRFYQEKRDQRQFVLSLLPSLEKELRFWINNRSTNYRLDDSRTLPVFHYDTRTNVPRPESYFEDVATAINKTESEKPLLYKNIAAAAETGWDFTSRFFEDKLRLSSAVTQRIWPVDLNAYMCQNYFMLSELFKMTGNQKKAAIYEEEYEKMRSLMMTLFYNETVGSWFDYDSQIGQHNTNFYTSNLMPLYANCYTFVEDKMYEKTMKYFENSGADNYPNGIPVSLLKTGQQWDLPNMFPNLNHMIIEGFERTGHVGLKQLALKIADELLRDIYLLYQNTSSMYEKYNVEAPQRAGGGGEYDVQVGFGWTNGVVLDLLRQYGDRLFYNGTSTLTTTTLAPRPSSGVFSVSVGDLRLKT